jgi:hypothetical protein
VAVAVVSTADTSTATGTTIAATLPGSRVNGNLLVAFVGFYSTIPSTPSGWAFHAGTTTAGNQSVRMYTRTVTGSESATITFTGFLSGDSRTATIIQLSGVESIGPGQYQFNESGGAHSTPSVTTTTPGNMVLRALHAQYPESSAYTWSWPPDQTEIADHIGPFAAGWRSTLTLAHSTQASAGASGTAVVTHSSGQTMTYASLTVAFQPPADQAQIVSDTAAVADSLTSILPLVTPDAAVETDTATVTATVVVSDSAVATEDADSGATIDDATAVDDATVLVTLQVSDEATTFDRAVLLDDGHLVGSRVVVIPPERRTLKVDFEDRWHDVPAWGDE